MYDNIPGSIRRLPVYCTELEREGEADNTIVFSGRSRRRTRPNAGCTIQIEYSAIIRLPATETGSVNDQLISSIDFVTAPMVGAKFGYSSVGHRGIGCWTRCLFSERATADLVGVTIRSIRSKIPVHP